MPKKDRLFALPYYGGKFSKLNWLLPQLATPHKSFVELFAGSAAVLLNKPPTPIEVLNDYAGEVVAFWTAGRDHPAELERAVTHTPAGEAEYMRALSLPPTDDIVERARRFHLRTCQSFSKIPTHKHQSFVGGVGYRWTRYKVKSVVDRMRDVVIENTDAARLLRRMANTDKATYVCSPMLFYCDPPYTSDSRVTQCTEYIVEGFDHEAFLDAVLSAPPAVKFAISGYDNPLYNDRLAKWHRVEFETQQFASSGRRRVGKGETRTEILWRNYELVSGGVLDA